MIFNIVVTLEYNVEKTYLASKVRSVKSSENENMMENETEHLHELNITSLRVGFESMAYVFHFDSSVKKNECHISNEIIQCI